LGTQEPGLGGGAQGGSIVPMDVKAPLVGLIVYGHAGTNARIKVAHICHIGELAGRIHGY